MIFFKNLKKQKAAPAPAPTVTIDDKTFGKCVFEKDADINSFRLIDCTSDLSFGSYESPEINIEIEENKITQALAGLAHVYDNHEKFITKFHIGVKEFCDEWEETDSNGQPVTLELVKKNADIYSISVDESYQGILTVSLRGGIVDDTGNDRLGCHTVIAEINCETDEVEYDLEG